MLLCMRNVVYIDCALNRRAASQQHPGGFFYPQISPLPFLSLSLFPFLSFSSLFRTRPLIIYLHLSCFIICPFSLAKNTCCPVTITDHLRGNLLPAVDSVWYSSEATTATASTRTLSTHIPWALDHNSVSWLVFATVGWYKKCVCVRDRQTGAVTSWGWLRCWRVDNVGAQATLGHSSRNWNHRYYLTYTHTHKQGCTCALLFKITGIYCVRELLIGVMQTKKICVSKCRQGYV